MYKIVTLKAYGDFLIACSAARVMEANVSVHPISIIASTHVCPLADALSIPDDRVTYITDQVSYDVPAVFDIRKQGIFSALRSLRGIIHQINLLHYDMELVFDSLGWRQRLIGLGRKIHGLPRKAKNIYLDYDCFFESTGVLVRSEKLPSVVGINRAIIIPGARMSFRVIPGSTISKIYRELETRGIQVKVILLEGDKIDLPLDMAVEVVPRNFSSLVSSLRDSNFIISADSLPAHLGAFINIPVFVFTPVPDWTSYWLPKPTFLTNGMANFVDLRPFRNWLDKYSSSDL